MKLSVIIPCLNGASTLVAQLEALARQQWGQLWELVLADNGSTDGSAELALSYRNRIRNVRIIDASARRGQPFALNTGAHAALGESIAFTDADDEVGDGWLAAMGDALAKHEFVACRTDAARFNPPGLQNSPQLTDVQTLWFPPWLRHAGGGTLGVRKTVFEAAGDFDETLPYLHDTDFCIRVQKLGVQLHFVPDAVLYLRNRSTLRGHFRQAANWSEYCAILGKRYWRPDDDKGVFWRRFAGDWLHVLRLVRSCRHPVRRFDLAWKLGWQIGRLKGIVKHRAVPV